MKEVTEKEFYGRIKKERLDLVVSIEGNYPYTEIFRFRDRSIWGKMVPSEVDSKKYPEYPWYVEHYYIV